MTARILFSELVGELKDPQNPPPGSRIVTLDRHGNISETTPNIIHRILSQVREAKSTMIGRLLALPGGRLMYARTGVPAVFDKIIDLYDTKRHSDFKIGVQFAAEIPNDIANIRKVFRFLADADANAKANANNLETAAVRAIGESIRSIGNGRDSLLDALLSEPKGHNASLVRRALETHGFRIDNLTVAIKLYQSPEVRVDAHDWVPIATSDAMKRASVKYEARFGQSKNHFAELIVCKLPSQAAGKEGAEDSVEGNIRQEIQRFLDGRYSMHTYRHGLRTIRDELQQHLDAKVGHRYGRRVTLLKLFTPDTQGITTEKSFEFSRSYSILGTNRSITIEHRGMVRIDDYGQYQNQGAQPLVPLVQSWIEHITRGELQSKTYADVVMQFFGIGAEGESQLEIALRRKLDISGRAYGISVNPVVAVCENLPEYGLIVGQDLEIEAEPYGLSMPNFQPELGFVIYVKLVDAGKLKSYLRGNSSVYEEIKARTKDAVRKFLVNVEPVEYYESSIPANGGINRLLDDLIRMVADMLGERFGLSLGDLRVKRGRDPLLERKSELSGHHEHLTFTCHAGPVAADLARWALGVDLTYIIYGYAADKFDLFKEKALRTAKEDQLRELNERLQSRIKSSLAGGNFDAFLAVTSRQELKQLTDDMLVRWAGICEATARQEFGLDISVPPGGLYIHIRPQLGHDVRVFLEERSRLDHDLAKALAAIPYDDTDREEQRKRAEDIRRQIGRLDEEIDARTKGFVLPVMIAVDDTLALDKPTVTDTAQIENRH